MQRRILVKPNLKLILLGALMIAVLHDVFTRGKSEPSFLRDPQYQSSWLSDQELAKLLREVEADPNSTGYLLISQAYEKRGNMRKAMLYFQKADAIGHLEPED